MNQDGAIDNLRVLFLFPTPLPLCRLPPSLPPDLVVLGEGKCPIPDLVCDPVQHPCCGLGIGMKDTVQSSPKKAEEKGRKDA